jgi:hypothetical protein
MGRYIFAVHSNPVEGREHEFNDWYSNRHLDDLLAVPGVISARRLTLADQQARQVEQPFKYLALYEVETDDPQAFIDELIARAETGRIPRSSALSTDLSAVFWKVL